MVNTNYGDKMKKTSIWLDNKYKSYPKLTRNKKVDVLIIGGGITGISTLYNLKDSNLKVALVEQNKIGYSTTGKSTGKLTFLQNDLLDKIRNKCDDKTASKYLKSQLDAIDKVTKVIKKEKISCNLEEVDSYLYTNNTNEIENIKDLERFLKANSIKVYNDKAKLLESKYTINVKNTYIFNPIKFIHGLIKETDDIYEDTSIKKIEKKDNIYICHTEKNTIEAKYVVIASHYPYFTIPYLFPMKTSLEKSYLSASRYKIEPFSLISYSNPFISMRTYEDYLVYLSNSHSVNTDTCDKKNFNELLKKIRDLNLEPEYLWSNIDVMTNDGMPIIGTLKDNILIATGYNTWGLATSFLAGTIIKDIITNKENEYINLFDPNRVSLSLGSIIKSLGGYIKGMKNGTEYTCPHLGCKLIYNEIEKAFDCPCHGSRFDEQGKCISAPANKNIKIDK